VLKIINYFNLKKMRNKIFMIVFFLAVVLIFNACLKDNVGMDWTSSLKGKMYAEFPNNGLNVFTIQPIATDQIFKILINVATDALPTSPITLKVKVDKAAMNAYNVSMQAADTSIHWKYKLYPSLTIIDTITTIEAGTRNAYVHVKLSRADTIQLSGKYMAPITLYSAAGGGTIISANKCSVLYKLPVANKWEGTYKMSGYILRDPYPDYTGFYSNRTVKLATNGVNSVAITSLWYWAGANASSGVAGIGNWQITINESVVPNTLSILDPTNAAVKFLATYPNRYEPATRTFYMSVYWGTGPTNRATTDTLTYYGPY
jgi:Domain of unknown function (DUF1735)